MGVLNLLSCLFPVLCDDAINPGDMVMAMMVMTVVAMLMIVMVLATVMVTFLALVIVIVEAMMVACSRRSDSGVTVERERKIKRAKEREKTRGD